MTAGQVSDCKGSDVLLQNLPKAKVLVADRCYDANRIRNDLKGKGIKPFIPPRRNRKEKNKYSGKLCECRHKIEISICRWKVLHRLAYSRDRSPDFNLTACCLAAMVIQAMSSAFD